MNKTVSPTSSGLRFWQVGNWCAHWGNEFREFAFRSSIKDFEVLNYARYLTAVLEKVPGSEVEAIPSWELYQMSPEQFDAKLEWANVIIFGDVETHVAAPQSRVLCQSIRQKICHFPGPL